MAGILLLGLILRNSSSNCSPAVMSTGAKLYGSSASSKKMVIFLPLGIGQY